VIIVFSSDYVPMVPAVQITVDYLVNIIISNYNTYT